MWTYETKGSKPLDMYMLLFVYLQYLYQWALDMGLSSPLAYLFNFIDWYVGWRLTKIVAFNLRTRLNVCSPNVIV